MQLSEFTFRLILLFIPGLITFFIVEALTTHKEAKFHRILFLSLIFGFISYLIYGIATLIFNLPFTFLKSLTNETNLNYTEILVVTLISFPIAFIISALDNYGVLYKFGFFLRASKTAGPIGVWGWAMQEYFENKYVIIRDLNNNLTYEGLVAAYSEVKDEEEDFLIINVKVFTSSTGELQYETPALYLSRDKKNLIIELPNT